MKRISSNFFCVMKMQKKALLGLRFFSYYLLGESNKVSNDLNVKTAVFYLLKIALHNASTIVLSGLRNGYWNGRLIKL